MEGKKPYLSRTMWFNALVGLGAILALAGVSGAETFMKDNAEGFGLIVSVVNILLRTVTKEKISIKE